MIFDTIKKENGEKISAYADKLIRNVFFDGCGDIAGGIKHIETEDGEKFVSLLIGQLDEPVGVGNLSNQEKVNTSIIFAFNNRKSIDIIIEWLTTIRGQIEEKNNQ